MPVRAPSRGVDIEPGKSEFAAVLAARDALDRGQRDRCSFCASMNERNTAFMRLRWPRPCALNHSSTSVSTRKWMEDLPRGGITTDVVAEYRAGH